MKKNVFPALNQETQIFIKKTCRTGAIQVDINGLLNRIDFHYKKFKSIKLLATYYGYPLQILQDIVDKMEKSKHKKTC